MALAAKLALGCTTREVYERENHDEAEDGKGGSPDHILPRLRAGWPKQEEPTGMAGMGCGGQKRAFRPFVHPNDQDSHHDDRQNPGGNKIGYEHESEFSALGPDSHRQVPHAMQCPQTNGQREQRAPPNQTRHGKTRPTGFLDYADQKPTAECQNDG